MIWNSLRGIEYDHDGGKNPRCTGKRRIKTSTRTQNRRDVGAERKRTDGGRVPEQIVRRTRGAHDQVDVARVDAAHLQRVPGRLDAQRAQRLDVHPLNLQRHAVKRAQIPAECRPVVCLRTDAVMHVHCA